jgi:uncharacterized membrane protein YjjB (DUF3815 family)
MSHPNKHWSWGMAFGRGVGSAIGACFAGIVAGAMVSAGLGALRGGILGAAGALVGGFLGACLGHWWDKPAEREETFRGAALYTLVVSGGIASVLYFLSAAASIQTCRREVATTTLVGALAGFLASASRSLIDELWHRGPSKGSPVTVDPGSTPSSGC